MSTKEEEFYKLFTGKDFVPNTTPANISKLERSFGESLGVLPPDPYVLRARQLCAAWLKSRLPADVEVGVEVVANMLRSEAAK